MTSEDKALLGECSQSVCCEPANAILRSGGREVRLCNDHMAALEHTPATAGPYRKLQEALVELADAVVRYYGR